MWRVRTIVTFGVVLVGVLTGCYKAASSKTSDTTREMREASRVGCLDIAVDRRTDLGTTAIVSYAFENRCGQPARVDLGWAQVIGRTAEGAELALIPTKQISAVTVGAHEQTEATLAYPAPTAIGQLCVDVASLAQQTPAQWRCFGNPEAVASR
ncbi:MAG: hypothetical protein JNL83_00400 [Myxococcales bacterium]|nr:hypothetical protein [Myxococcales bacterium]